MSKESEQNQQKLNSKNGAKSLAILPFRFLRSGDKADNDLLSAGMADALAARLYNVPNLQLRPTSSVLQLVRDNAEPFEIGEKLKVDYALTGHILTVGERLRFSVQLLSINTRSVVWAAQFDESEADIFSLEDSISARVVEALQEDFFNKPVKDKKPAAPDSVTLQMPPAEITLSDKPENTAEFKTTRRKPWVWGIAAAILLTVGAVVFYSLRQPKIVVLTKPDLPKTLVVLPFRSESEANKMVSVGLADALTSKLGTVHALSVRSANGGRELAATGKNTAVLSSEIGVNYIVRGNLQNSDKLNAVVEIANAKTGDILLAESIAEPNNSLPLLQIKIAERIVDFFQVELSAAEREQINKRYTENNLAYELYLVGRFQLSDRTADGLNKSINTFKQAIEKDPNFALAHSGLADAYRLQRLYQVPSPPELFELSKANAEKALALDENLAEAHATLAEIRLGERNRTAAEQSFRRAIELNPSYASAHHWYALALTTMGKHSEALKEIKIAQQLDPTSDIISSAVGMVYFYDRRYVEGLAECERVLQRNPAFTPAHRISRGIYQMMGDYEAALRAYKKERNFLGDADENERGWMMTRGMVEAISGRREAALKLIERSLTLDLVRNNPQSFGYEIALAYAYADDKENALLWLEKSEAARDRKLVYAPVEPIFLDKLANEPRFAALVKKLQTPLS